MDWALPDRKFFCLVGRGDSTKSTILEAIRRVFHPQWNFAFADADFNGGKPNSPIKIESIITDFPDEFKNLGRYGTCLCGWNRNESKRTDEPGDGFEDALWVRLSVGDDLEPSWRIVKTGDDEGREFRANDRLKLAVSLIGSYSDRHLTWSKGSILSQLTEAENISSSLANAARDAKAALETRRAQALVHFDKAAQTAETTAKALGIHVAQTYKAHLDVDAVNVRLGGLALHDGDMPLRQLGLGSRRMLTSGLQKQALKCPHLTLFDEIEFGLEPHRIARLIKHLKEDTSGTYFLATHSPVVLREVTIEDLHIVRCNDGKTDVVSANVPALADVLQGKIRAGAEAFLAAKIAVCEGKTEIGLLRGLDDSWIAKGKLSLAYQGVAYYDAGGASKIKVLAQSIRALGYDVAVIVDSDAPDNFSGMDAEQLRALGVSIVTWDGNTSIEERAFFDLPWDAVLKSVDCAATIKGDLDRVLDQISTQYGAGFNRDMNSWKDTAELRKAIGKAAKPEKTGWFKRIAFAEEWTHVISPYLDQPAMAEKDFVKKLVELRSWIDRE
jgi:hypothetical protein